MIKIGILLVVMCTPFQIMAQPNDIDCEYVVTAYQRCENLPTCDVVTSGFQRNVDLCKDQNESHPKTNNPIIPTPKFETTTPQLSDAQGKLKEIQALLTQNGFDTQGVDGVFGKNTCAAIASFSQKVQTPFSCEYSVGLRDALIANLSRPKDVPTKDEPKNDSDPCLQIAGWVENGRLETLWREMASERLAGLQEHKQLLLSNEAELGRYEDSTTGIVSAASETLAVVAGTTKIAAGIGLGASLAGKSKEGVALFGGVYASLTAGEDLGKVIRGIYDGELASAADPILRFKSLAERRIKSSLDAVSVIAEGANDNATVVLNKKRQRSAVREIRHQSLLMRKAIEETEKKINSSQIYIDLLNHLSELKSQCGGPKMVLP